MVFPVHISVVNVFMLLKHGDEHTLKIEFFSMKVLPTQI